MAGLLLDLGAEMTCPHGGRASALSVDTRVLANGMPVLMVSDSFPIANCPHEEPTPDGATPQPCTENLWSAPAARVLVDGRPVLADRSPPRPEVERVLGLGATVVADRRRPADSGWVTLADPEGNEFCIVRSHAELETAHRASVV